MGKTFLLGIFLFTFLSCKQNKNTAVSENDSVFEISTQNWPVKTKFKVKTSELIKDWQEFNALETSFDALYTIGNTEDLSLVLDDLIEKLKLLEKVDYPQPFNKPQIKSRQKVFHTYVLKTKGDMFYRIDAQTSVLQMINAHNDVLNQMNAITGNTLDLKSLLNTEK